MLRPQNTGIEHALTKNWTLMGDRRHRDTLCEAGTLVSVRRGKSMERDNRAGVVQIAAISPQFLFAGHRTVGKQHFMGV